MDREQEVIADNWNDYFSKKDDDDEEPERTAKKCIEKVSKKFSGDKNEK